jgi:hypothetical protein
LVIVFSLPARGISAAWSSDSLPSPANQQIDLLVQRPHVHLLVSRRRWGLGLVLLWLSACANQPPQQPASPIQQVKVHSVKPMSDPEAQLGCPVPPPDSKSDAQPKSAPLGVCVFYELTGLTYGVWLPSDPGEFLALQVPVQDLTHSVRTPPPPYPGWGVPVAPVYPLVFYGGIYYRPKPHVAPFRPGLSPPLGRDGRRLRH